MAGPESKEMTLSQKRAAGLDAQSYTSYVFMYKILCDIELFPNCS